MSAIFTIDGFTVPSLLSVSGSPFDAEQMGPFPLGFDGVIQGTPVSAVLFGTRTGRTALLFIDAANVPGIVLDCYPYNARNSGIVDIAYGIGTVTSPVDGYETRPCFATTYTNVIPFLPENDPAFTQRNTFQCVIVDRTDNAPGDFDIVFNYEHLGWDTYTDAGTTGVATVSIGEAVTLPNNLTQVVTLLSFPGSGAKGSFLDTEPLTGLVHNSANSPVPGRYIFRVRGGVLETPPDLPGPTDGPVDDPPATVPTGDLAGNVTTDSDFGADIALCLPRAAVSASPYGGYEIDRIPVGLYSVLFSECGFVPQTIPVIIEPDSLTQQDAALLPFTDSSGVPITSTGFVAGWALDSVTGVPLVGALVEATPLAGGETRSVVTDEGGAWILALPLGDWSMTVAQAGYGTQDAGTVSVVGGCTVNIGPGGIVPPDASGDGELWGYVSDAVTDAVIAGATVTVQERPEFMSVSDTGGQYDLRLLPAPETVTLYVNKDGYRPRRATVKVLGGTAQRVDLGLAADGVPVGNVEGYVSAAADGSPVADAVARVPGVTQTLTTQAGYYLLTDLPL